MHLQLLKLETQSKFPEFAPVLDQIKRNLEEYKYLFRDITWCIHAFLISHELERTICHSNLTRNKHQNEDKI